MKKLNILILRACTVLESRVNSCLGTLTVPDTVIPENLYNKLSATTVYLYLREHSCWFQGRPF